MVNSKEMREIKRPRYLLMVSKAAVIRVGEEKLVKFASQGNDCCCWLIWEFIRIAYQQYLRCLVPKGLLPLLKFQHCLRTPKGRVQKKM